ncbi:MAG: hypothetical protein R3C32_01420 [Chloroflexota bacterium]
MGIEDNKALVRRFVAQVFEEGDVSAVDQLVAADFVPHVALDRRWPEAT